MPLLPPAGLGDFRVVETPQTLAVTVSPVAKQAGDRIAIGFSVFVATASISTRANMSNNQGWSLVLQNPTQWFLWQDVGALVNSDWYAIGAAGSLLTVFEVFYTPNSEQRKVQLGNAAKTSDSSPSTHRESVSSKRSYYGSQT